MKSYSLRCSALVLLKSPVEQICLLTLLLLLLLRELLLLKQELFLVLCFEFQTLRLAW